MDTLNQLSIVRQEVIRKEAEIESIFERIDLLDPVDPDDIHRARTKLRHEKERLVELRCRAAQLEIDTIRLGKHTYV